MTSKIDVALASQQMAERAFQQRDHYRALLAEAVTVLEPFAAVVEKGQYDTLISRPPDHTLVATLRDSAGQHWHLVLGNFRAARALIERLREVG